MEVFLSSETGSAFSKVAVVFTSFFSETFGVGFETTFEVFFSVTVAGLNGSVTVLGAALTTFTGSEMRTSGECKNVP